MVQRGRRDERQKITRRRAEAAGRSILVAAAREKNREKNRSGPSRWAVLKHAPTTHLLRSYKWEAARFAALWPHMPWTPPPGGVEEEQM
jgi:hypothetical protein